MTARPDILGGLEIQMLRHSCSSVVIAVLSLLNITVLFSCIALGQGETEERRTSIREELQAEVERWQTRINSLREIALQESLTLHPAEKPLYLSNLARLFWTSDRPFAEAILRRAANDLRIAVRDFDGKSNGRRHSLISALEIISQLDKTLTRNLVNQIQADAEFSDDSNLRSHAGKTEIYALVAKSIVSEDPEAALKLASQSLNFGYSDTVPDILALAYKKQPQLGNEIIKKALARSRNAYSPDVFRFEKVLGSYLTGRSGPVEFPSELKLRFLQQQYLRVSEAVQLENDRQSRCQIAWYSAKFVPDVDQNLPLLSEDFRKNIDSCIKFLPKNAQAITRLSMPSDQAVMPSELIAMARSTSDIDLKIRLWRTALAALEKDAKYAEIISQLDSVDGDDFREVSPVGWADWRMEAAFRQLVRSLDERDFPSAYRILEKMPGTLRPELRIRVLTEIGTKEHDGFCWDNLNQLLKELDTLDLPPIEMAKIYLATIQLCLNIRPAEAIPLIDRLAKSIDKAESENGDFQIEKDWADLKSYIKIDAKIIELDEVGMLNSLNSMTSRRGRLRIRLGLIESAKEYYLDAIGRLNTLRINKEKDGAKGTTAILRRDNKFKHLKFELP